MYVHLVIPNTKHRENVLLYCMQGSSASMTRVTKVVAAQHPCRRDPSAIKSEVERSFDMRAILTCSVEYIPWNWAILLGFAARHPYHVQVNYCWSHPSSLMKPAMGWAIDVLIMAGATLYTATALCCEWAMWSMRKQFFIALR